jgi:hypothetical protein
VDDSIQLLQLPEAKTVGSVAVRARLFLVTHCPYFIWLSGNHPHAGFLGDLVDVQMNRLCRRQVADFAEKKRNASFYERFLP